MARSKNRPIRLTSQGSFSNTENFITKAKKSLAKLNLWYYGKKGVEALRLATPKDTGLTAESWYYEIREQPGIIKITWNNSNKPSNNRPIAVLIYYGHATKSGAYVEGRDFINPAMQPIFDKMADQIWREVVG